METPTFAFAADSYIEHGGQDRYLPRLIARFGPDLVTRITPMAVRTAAIELYPDASPATRNRQAITPARAVLYHAHEMGWRMPARIRMFPAPAPRRMPANRRWLETFIERCDADQLPHLAACVLFMNLTGARVSEAVRLVGRDVDLRAKTAVLLRTKTEVNSVRYMPDQLVERIRDLAPEPDAPVFRYTSRYSVNERICAVCDRAGLPRLSSHRVGRHAFATNALTQAWGSGSPWTPGAGSLRRSSSKPTPTPSTPVAPSWIASTPSITRTSSDPADCGRLPDNGD